MKNKYIALLALFVMAGSAFAQVQSESIQFSPMATNLETQVINVSGEVLQIGVRSSVTNAFDLAITDYSTGTVLYSATNLTATAYNFVPMVAATDPAGATITNTLGTVYLPANVVSMRVKAGNSTTTNDVLTVSVVVNKSP